ncbi:hypothetical protein GCM10015535_44940 [Streptomyces gelaticus]|uniref:Uncharacterized protein n=1 Tax=Streptomyces gelaticus TaxID=285446 RepID=A0ABQ2W2K3_9ACTN|nr:hypothetical protein GCM10015535_44940 [Streptomyces gelaticus]
MDVQPVADLPEAEALPAQGDRLLAQTFEVGVLARDFRHVTSVARNADVRYESLLDSPFQAIPGCFVAVLRADVLSGSPENEVRSPVGWMA